MARTLSAVTLSAPAAPVTQGSGSTFTFTCTPTFSGTSTVNAYDLKFLVNPAGAGFVTITGATGLSTGNTNPVTGLTATTATSITVTCATAGPYTIEIQGAPATGGSFTLTSGTQTVTVLMPNVQTDWPLPAPKRPPNEVINQGIITLPAAAPISIIDWPLPASRKRLLDFPQQFLPLNDVAVISAPFSQTDWSLPSARKRVHGVPQQFLPLNDAVASLPFNQTDWSTPAKAKRVAELLNQNSLPANSIVVAVDTFGQCDWPLPLKAKKPDELLNQGILPDTPAAIVVDTHGQYDWPLPKKPRRPDEYIKQGIPDLLNFDTTTVQRAASIVDAPSAEWRDISFVQRGIVIDSIPPALLPFNQTNWPPPKRARGFDELIGQSILPENAAPPPTTGDIYTVGSGGLMDNFPISGVSAVPPAGLGLQRRTAV